MNTLHLNLKKEWFDMILSGIKKEEYREIKDSMVSIFFDWKRAGGTRSYVTETLKLNLSVDEFGKISKVSDTIIFSNGMTPPVPRFEIQVKGFDIGTGNLEWGAKEDVCYFRLKLGNVLWSENIKISNELRESD